MSDVSLEKQIQNLEGELESWNNFSESSSKIVQELHRLKKAARAVDLHCRGQNIGPEGMAALAALSQALRDR